MFEGALKLTKLFTGVKQSRFKECEEIENWRTIFLRNIPQLQQQWRRGVQWSEQWRLLQCFQSPVVMRIPEISLCFCFVYSLVNLAISLSRFQPFFLQCYHCPIRIGLKNCFVNHVLERRIYKRLIIQCTIMCISSILFCMAIAST